MDRRWYFRPEGFGKTLRPVGVDVDVDVVVDGDGDVERPHTPVVSNSLGWKAFRFTSPSTTTSTST
jgi:hypothetical protein